MSVPSFLGKSLESVQIYLRVLRLALTSQKSHASDVDIIAKSFRLIDGGVSTDEALRVSIEATWIRSVAEETAKELFWIALSLAIALFAFIMSRIAPDEMTVWVGRMPWALVFLLAGCVYFLRLLKLPHLKAPDKNVLEIRMAAFSAYKLSHIVGVRESISSYEKKHPFLVFSARRELYQMHLAVHQL